MAPGDFRPYAALGDLEREHEQYARAEEGYRRALALHADDAELLAKLADVVARQGVSRLEEATGLLEQAQRIAPESVHVLMGLAEVHRRRGEFAGAVAALTRVITRDPTLARAHYELGVNLIALGDRDGAVDPLKRAAELEPHNTEFQKLLDALVGGHLTVLQNR